MHASELRSVHDSLKLEATRLAGGLGDLSQRAMTYHHLFRHSGRNHVFPLIAAHGALWARGHFAFGAKLARCLAWQYALDAERQQAQLRSVDEFANAFREINRRVCVDTYANYHFTATWGEDSAASEIVPPTLLDALNRVHAARRQRCELPDAEKRRVFEAHFLHEQEHVVGPSLERAVAGLDWPLMKFLGLKPLIRFAFLPRQQLLWFWNFANKEERIANGLLAFDIAASVGWTTVERALHDYHILPKAFFEAPVRHFSRLRAALLAVQ